MRLSPAAEFAVRGVLVLAEHYGQGPVTLATVCSRRDLSKEYMTKLFSVLAKAGLILPIRGKGGGYTLARDPSRISLLEVIQAVEGPLAMNFCQYEPARCQQEDCRMRAIWTDIQNSVRQKLSCLTLDKCLRELPVAGEAT